MIAICAMVLGDLRPLINLDIYSFGKNFKSLLNSTFLILLFSYSLHAHQEVPMKRSLTVLSRSLLTSLMLFLPTGLLQASILSVPDKTIPIQREGKIIAQLPGFKSDFNIGGFEPKENGFNFSNSDLTKALQENDFNDSNNNQEWGKYFQGTLLWFFGSKVCLNEDDIKDVIHDYTKCILTAPAKEWLNQNIQSMQYGLCEGIATASLYLWLWEKDEKNYVNRTNFYTDPADEDSKFRKLLRNNNKRVNSLKADEPELQAYITNLFILQALKKVYSSTDAIRNEEKPSQILERLIGSMQLNPYDPYTMGIYKFNQDEGEKPLLQEDGTPKKLTQGHSLVPFAVEEKDKEKGIYKVYVYDSNHPGEIPYVEFDTKNETWSYKPDSDTAYTGNDKTKNLDLTRLSLRDLKKTDYFDCPFCDDDSNSSTGTQPVDISLIGQGDLSVTDLEGNEIPDVDTVPFKGGLGKDVPPSIHIPPTQSNQPFKITLRGTQQNNDTRIVMVGSGFTVGFEKISLVKDEELKIYVYPGSDGPKVSFEANNDNTTIPKLFFALNDDSTDTGYNFEISDIQLSKGKLMQVVADTERKRLYFGDNDENEDTYNLDMEFTTTVHDQPYKYQIPVTLDGKKIAYFAYGEWRANLYGPKSEQLAFYQAKFQSLGSSYGAAFNENTISGVTRVTRNAGSAPKRT